MHLKNKQTADVALGRVFAHILKVLRSISAPAENKTKHGCWDRGGVLMHSGGRGRGRWVSRLPILGYILFFLVSDLVCHWFRTGSARQMGMEVCPPWEGD